MRLVAASLEPPSGLAEFLDAARADNWLFESDLPYIDKGIEHFLRRQVDFAAGKNLPEGWVPATTFWLLDHEDRAVAMSNLRHMLTPQLLNRGGHIGYYVMELQRGKGYGTQVLALTLIQASLLGLDRVLVSADSDNEQSIRIIERNRGLLEDERIDDTTGSLYRRYWIDVTSP
jgi:predicted acetyltransferase